MSAINTFLGVLFVVMFLVAVMSKGALKGPDAFALRWTVISLGVGFSAFVAWLRWRFGQRSLRSSGGPPAAIGNSPVVVKPSPPIAAASRQAIVFRQHIPPRHDPGTLSFFGGAPVAPPRFRWPRTGDGGSSPLTFLMQVDCAAIPATARLGLLPDRGVLYVFLDLAWTGTDPFRVLYEEGGADRATVQPPGDLGLAYGNGAIRVWKWTQSKAECPQLLP
jgi:hypothetical protein